MTGREAIGEAMEIVARASIGRQRKREILEGLALCRDTYPFTEWTREAILDACARFVREQGCLRGSDLGKNGLPCHTVIKRRFGLTAGAFRDKYFPQSVPKGSGAEGPKEQT